MQFLRLYKTCRIMCYSLLLNDVNFVEIEFEWFTLNHVLVRFNANISYKIHFFFEEKILVALYTYMYVKK